MKRSAKRSARFKKLTASFIILSQLISIPLVGYGFQFKHSEKSNKEASDTKYRVVYEVCKDKYISEVISRSSMPYHLTAIAKIESDFRPQVKGDSGASLGLYQIQPSIWSRVPDSIEGQTKKAEKILLSLKEKYGIKEAVKRYNGSGRQATLYQKKVLRLVYKMEQRERELNGKA